MKKKLLLTFLGIMVFSCLFAISVLAVDYSENAILADGTHLPIYDKENNPLIWYVSGVDENGDNIYKSVPNNRNEPNANNDTYVTYTINKSWMTQLENINFHIWNSATGEYEVYTEESCQTVVVNLRGLTNFQYINNGFKVSDIQYIYFNEGLKDFCEYFKNSTALRLVDLSECTNLDGGFGGVRNFYNCTNLHTVRLAPGASYSLACSKNNNWRFSNTAITEIVFPSNITSLGVDNFKNCANLESIYILGNDTDLGQRNFLGCSSLTSIYILGDNPTMDATSFKENFYECVDGNTTLDFKDIGKYFFFTTTNTEYLNTIKDAISATAIISYTDYVASPQSYTEGRYIISGTSACDVYYGHTIDESSSNSCAGICTVCGSVVMLDNPVHNYITKIEYSNYLENGTKTQVCQNSNCVYNKAPNTSSTEPLFVCLGYSVAENGEVGIDICFIANSSAIEEYTNITGKTLTYGVFAVSENNLGNKEIFENGEASKGVIFVDVTKHNFTTFELKVIGFTNEQKDITFAMGAYVAVTDGDTTEYSYMQDDSVGDFNGKYYFVSYNKVEEAKQ
ncbi:MAG: leucine-rich repeat protein [Clostridia bacterium]|nr:leucine-rich repeat protein [Clostridia bacterium]